MVKDGEKTCEIQIQLQEFLLMPNMNLQTKYILEWKL
jgi:hypothetical protein